jgi:hypothetical protein
MSVTSKLLALSCLTLPLIACADEPEPVEIVVSPLACGRVTCDLDLPVAVGAQLAFQATPLGLTESARVSDPTIATIEPGFLRAEDAYTLTALKTGTVTVELLDADQQVTGTRAFEVLAADHLEAAITVVQGNTTTQLDRVAAEQPQAVPAGSTVLIAVDARNGALALNGWSEYAFEATLTNGARVQRWDREGHATLSLTSGQQSVRFTSTAASVALDGRFILAVQ